MPDAEKDAGWLVPQTCVRCGEQTMHDSRVCGRCAEKDAQGMRCDAQYGSNPDRCYLQFNHRGAHSNQWGTTWPRVTSPVEGRDS